MQVIFAFIYFVFYFFFFLRYCTVLCLWLFFKVFIWHSMFYSSLDLFYSACPALAGKLSVSVSHLKLKLFKWRTKLTKLTPCQLAVLAGFNRNLQVIRVTQWRRECNRIWISGQMLTMLDVKLLARSFMASLGLVSSLSFCLSFILSLSLSVTDIVWFSIFRLQKVKLSPWRRWTSSSPLRESKCSMQTRRYFIIHKIDFGFTHYLFQTG